MSKLFGEASRLSKEFKEVSWSTRVSYSGMPQSRRDEAFLSGSSNARAILSAAIREAQDYETESQLADRAASSHRATRVAFVVHGHDDEMKEAIARFLERLDIEPIILHEQANSGQTIIEKFEQHSDVAIAVVLLSPDDVGAQAGAKRKLRRRARQNVVLELGYFIGRLGRHRVCPIVRGDVELPSDMHGLVYIPYENDSWRIHIVRELKAAGIDVNANNAF